MDQIKNKIIGKRIRDLRKQFGMLQIEMADKLDMGKSSYANYELGYRQPSFEVVQQLTEIFNTTADYLLGIIDDPRPVKPIKDIKTILQTKGLYFDGRKLSQEDIKLTIQLLDRISKLKQA